MPIDTSFQHPPSTSGREKMEHRQVVQAGTSPFYGTPRPQPVDRTRIVSCAECHRHFLNETFLAAHTESQHKPRPKTVDAAATEVVRATIADRISSGELRVGQTVILAQLVGQLGTTRHHVQAAIEQLRAAGALGYEGAGCARRVIVVGG
jgi:regulatory GntR family protein